MEHGHDWRLDVFLWKIYWFSRYGLVASAVSLALYGFSAVFDARVAQQLKPIHRGRSVPR